MMAMVAILTEKYNDWKEEENNGNNAVRNADDEKGVCHQIHSYGVGGGGSGDGGSSTTCVHYFRRHNKVSVFCMYITSSSATAARNNPSSHKGQYRTGRRELLCKVQ